MSNYIVAFSIWVTPSYGGEHHGDIAGEESKLKGGTSVRKDTIVSKKKTNCCEMCFSSVHCTTDANGSFSV